MRRCPRARPSGAGHASCSGYRFPTPYFYGRQGKGKDSRNASENANIGSEDDMDTILFERMFDHCFSDDQRITHFARYGSATDNGRTMRASNDRCGGRIANDDR